MKSTVRKLLRRAKVEVRGKAPEPDKPSDLDDQTLGIIERVRSETMTSPERIAALVQAVRYIDRFHIPGAIVECGVWRGGSSMAAALAHQLSGPPHRPLFLFDTFEGMPEPTAEDVDIFGSDASKLLSHADYATSDIWAVGPLAAVKSNMAAVGYPESLTHIVVGRVEETIPATLPDPIALLRLDTDWYLSTQHELAHLVPAVAPGGVLVIDDYGHWIGARKAVDEWIASESRPILLNRIDYTGRIAVLP